MVPTVGRPIDVNLDIHRTASPASSRGTGPEGDRHHGWWHVRAVDPPHTLEFEDGFADAAGQPRPDLPTGLIRVVLSELAGGRTQMVVTTSWASGEAMAQILAMGTDAGMTAAVNQIDGLLLRSAT